MGGGGGRKRGAGQGREVLKAQHFDTGISLVRRLAIKLARYSGVGTTDYDQQIVAGTIGNLMGSFLMQLVGSPATRPPFAHLWGLGGVPAIYNGGGKATPIFDSWANQDTDIAQLTVDIGTQTLSGGEIGIIMRGSNDDAQSLVFMTSGTGGGGGGGGLGPGFYADGLDGAIDLAPLNTINNGIVDPFNNDFSQIVTYRGAFRDPSTSTIAGPFYALVLLNRDLYCTDLNVPATITDGGVSYPLIFVPGPYKIRATGTVTVNGAIANDGWLRAIWVVSGLGLAWSGGKGGLANYGTGGNGLGAYKMYSQSTTFSAPGASTAAGDGGGPGPSFLGGAGGVGLGTIGNRTCYEWDADPALGFGTSGAGGGGGGTANGAVGGDGANALYLFGATITGAGTISANGQKGQSLDGSGSPAVYGGGGGNPAPVFVISDACSITPTSNPGLGGAGTTHAGMTGRGLGYHKKFVPSTGTYA